MFSQFSKMYIGATRIAHIRQAGQVVWDEVTGPAPVAPSWQTQPSISPASGAVGTVFSLGVGTAAGTTPLTITGQLLLGTTDITSQITVGAGGELTYTSTAPGTLSWSEAVSGPGGGPIQSAVAQATVTAAAATTTVSFADGISAVVQGAVTTVQHADGPVQIISGGPVTILSATPATTGVGAALRNGHARNPQMITDTSAPQGYDGRRVAAIDGMAVTFPLTIQPGDVLVLTKSADDTAFAGSPAARCGYTDAAAMIYVAATPAAAGSLAPAAIGWTGRSTLASPAVVDYAAKAAALPVSFGVTGITYATQAQVARALRFNPFFAQRDATEQNSGYESYMPSGWGQITPPASNWNYGQYVAQGLNDLLMALIAPTATVPLATKAEILLRLDSFANQTRQVLSGAADQITSDGGHQQFVQVACALADWMRGIEPSLANVLGNWAQAYRISDQDVFDSTNGFGDPNVLSDVASYSTRMWFHHWRKIAGVSGNVLTVETWRNSGTNEGDEQYPRWAPCRIVRQSDGATAIVTAESTGSISGSTTATKTLTISAQPTPAFAVGDVIHMRALDGIAAGTADWKERASRLNTGAPVSSRRYQDQQRWGGLLVLRAMGLITPETLIAWDYFVRANLANTPASDDYPGTLSSTSEPITWAVYQTHMTAITAVAQPYLPVPAPTFYPPVAAVDLTAAGGSLFFPENNNNANAAVYTDQKGLLYQNRVGIAQLPASTTAWASFAIVRLPKDKRDQNALFGIMGSGGTGGNRWWLRYGADGNGLAAERAKFKGYNYGGSGAAATLQSPDWTEDSALVVFQCDGASNWQVDWYSLIDGARYAGTPANVVCGLNNLNTSTEFNVGGNGNITTWTANGGGAQWPGEIEAVGIVTTAVTPSQWQSIALGADIITTIGAASLKWLRKFDGTAASLAKPAAATADTTAASVAVPGNGGSIPNSTLKPGSTLRRQSTATWLTMAGLSNGWVYGLTGGNTTRMVQFSGAAGGLNGQTVEVLVYETSGGRVVRDWTAVAVVNADAWSGQIELPKGEGWWAAKARCNGVIFDRRDRFAVGYKVALVGQSQINLAIDNAVTGPATLTTPMSASYLTNGPDLNGNRYVRMTRIGMDYDWGSQRAFVNSIRYFDPLTPFMLIDVAEPGTGIDQFIDDTNNARKWSDFQQLLDLYGNDITSCVMNWGTTDATSDKVETKNRLDAFLSGSGPLSKNHNLNASLAAGFKFIISPLTRHNEPSGTGTTVATRAAQVEWANAADYPVGPPTLDMRIADDQGPHESGTVINGAALLIHRMAVAVARGLGLDTSKNPYFGAATRAGAEITVAVGRQVGGALYSPTPAALVGFEVSENGGTTWTAAGFTAAISGTNVVLTKSAGNWAANTQLRYGSNMPTRAKNAAGEDAIVNAALYEAWAGDVVLGKGLPVSGSLVSGKWHPDWSATSN